MHKSTLPRTTMFTFVQRTDLALTTHTADVLAEAALRAEALRRKFRDDTFKKHIVDYALVMITGVAAGTLLALLMAWLA